MWVPPDAAPQSNGYINGANDKETTVTEIDPKLIQAASRLRELRDEYDDADRAVIDLVLGALPAEVTAAHFSYDDGLAFALRARQYPGGQWAFKSDSANGPEGEAIITDSAARKLARVILDAPKLP